MWESAGSATDFMIVADLADVDLNPALGGIILSPGGSVLTPMIVRHSFD